MVSLRICHRVNIRRKQKIEILIKLSILWSGELLPLHHPGPRRGRPARTPPPSPEEDVDRGDADGRSVVQALHNQLLLRPPLLLQEHSRRLFTLRGNTIQNLVPTVLPPHRQKVTSCLLTASSTDIKDKTKFHSPNSLFNVNYFNHNMYPIM